MINRAYVDKILDRARFATDTFPRLDYQPAPWLGRHKARRSSGVESRWEAIRSNLPIDTRSAIDVGCNTGYFSVELALRGIPTIGIERFGKYYRPALYTKERLQLDNLGIMVLDLQLKTLPLIPSADCILFLSVWHHLVRGFGLEIATQYLTEIWSRTDKVMFFESGEGELDSSWGLPPIPEDPRRFFSQMFETACPGAEVTFLGRHAAFTPDGASCERGLYRLAR